MKEETKKLLFNIFDDYEEYNDIIDSVRSYHSNREITDEEYDYILENYDNLLNEWYSKKDEEMARKDNYEHTETLLSNCIEYLVELWGINEDSVEKKFRDVLGFEDEDIKYYGLEDEKDYVEEDEEDE